MKRILAFFFASATLTCAGFAQTTVYNNTTSSLNNDAPLLPEWRDDSAEMGDEIWLEGVEREIVGLRLLFFYRGTLPGTMDLQIRFRGVDLVTQGPGEAFYESGIIASVPTLEGVNEYNFAIPNVVVPDHFTWTVQAYNRQGSVGEIGPSYYNPGTVGFSDDFFWISDMGSEWTAYSWGGDPYANLAAEFTAVPEPATMLVLAPAVALFIRRRKKKA